DDEAGVRFDAVAQVVERFLVDAARIEIVRIGRQRERPLAEVVEPFIHGAFSWMRLPPAVVATPSRPNRAPAARARTPASRPRENRCRSTGSRAYRRRAAAARG